ncbi:MAG: YcgN family cysteine cluster protein [Pseudomonadota bacterium]
MSYAAEHKALSDRFWETKRLDQMSQTEWEALCDGCGKCCLNKLEDEDSGEVVLTRVACRLLDDSSCRCAHYSNRHAFVPDCIVLSPKTIDEHMYWLPQTCAYKLLRMGKDLPAWHPLVTGRPGSVHEAGVSMRGRTVSEFDTPDEDWENHIIDEPT